MNTKRKKANLKLRNVFFTVGFTTFDTNQLHTYKV